MQDVINFNLLKEYDTTLKDILEIWTKQKAYSLGDKVKYKGHLLECTTAGTSGTTTLNFTGLDIGDTIIDGTVVWEIIEPTIGKGIDFYTVGESYNINDIVIYNGNIYQCITAHIATSTFDNAKWTEISASGGVELPEWQPNTSYTTGKYLVHEGTVYKVDNSFTSGTTFSDTNLTSYIAPIMQGATSSANGKSGIVPKPTTTDVDKFLKGDGTWGSTGGGLSIWQANTSYNVNDVVIDSNLIWQCATSHTSTTTFDESKWICISGGEISNGYEIVPLWSGTFSFNNTTEGATPSDSTPMIELSEPISNFEYIYVVSGVSSSEEELSSSIFTVSEITVGTTCFRIGPVGTGSIYTTASICFYDNTHIYIKHKNTDNWPVGQIKLVRGIRKAKPIVSSGMKYETLWEGEAGSLSGASSDITINLSESLKRYQKFGVQVKCRHGSSGSRYYYREFDVSYFMSWLSTSISDEQRFSISWGFSSADDYVDFTHTSTDVQLMFNCNDSIITKIIGISEGVQIPTGVQAARVTLWEGQYNAVNSPLLLSDSIDNYDQFEITLSNDEGDERGLFVYDVSSIVYNRSTVFRAYNGRDTTYRYAVGFEFADSSNIVLNSVVVSGWPDCYLTKIVGIKYIQPDSYSTEEKLIGTWIDGKPLYRKVFTNVGNNYDTGLANSTYEIKRVYGSAVTSTATYNVPNETDYLTITHTGLVETNRQSALNWIAVEYTKN